MKYKLPFFLTIKIFIVVLLISNSSIASEKTEPLDVTKTAMQNRPLLFMENKGQIMDSKGNSFNNALFSANGNGIKMYLNKNGITYLFIKNTSRPEASSEPIQGKMDAMKFEFHKIDMKLLNANPNAIVLKEEKGEYYENFYLPHCGKSGITDVGSYKRITYKNIYPNIDWIVYSKGHSIKYDFIVHPGGNPAEIKMQYVHQNNITANKNGSMEISSSLGNIIEEKPFTYQGNNIKIESSFLKTNDILAFTIGNYDNHNDLVIDPGVSWGTFYGGTYGETGKSCTSDSNDNIYLVGNSGSTDLCLDTNLYTFSGTNSGSIDSYIAKFNSSGNLLWTSYYGGSGDDFSADCKPDVFPGWIYLVGTTSSTNLYTNNAFQPNHGGGVLDGFVADFDAGGYLNYCSYLGGNGDENINSVDVNSNGDVFFAGHTSSSSGIASGTGYQQFLSGIQNAFLIKYDLNWNKLWGSYLGTNNETTANSISILNDSAYVFMIGTTSSTSGLSINTDPSNSYAGNNDAFIAKWDMNTGNVLASRYFGGPNVDEGNAISTHPNNLNIFSFAGTTNSTSGIATANQLSFGGGTDAFFGWSGYNFAINYMQSSYYGGSGNESGWACAINNGRICIGGSTNTTAGLTTSNALQPNFGGFTDGFVASYGWWGIASDFSSYFGAYHIDAVNSMEFINGSQQLAIAGTTVGQNFSTNNQGIYYGNGYQQYNRAANGENAFLAKIATDCGGTPNPLVISSSSGAYDICSGSSITLNATGGTNYLWNGSVSGNSLTVTNANTYTVTGDAYGCSFSNSVTVNVNPLPTVSIIPTSSTLNICEGDSINLTANSPTATRYQWNLDGLPLLADTNAVAIVDSAGVYTVIAYNIYGCSKTSGARTLNVNSPPLAVIAAVGSTDTCAGSTLTLFANNGASSYQWYKNGNPVPQSTSDIFIANATGNYYVRETGNGCISISNTLAVTFHPFPSSVIDYAGIQYTCLGNGVNFVANSNTGISFQWFLNNSAIPNASNANYVANSSGNYTLSSTGIGNCSTLSAAVELNPAPLPTEICFASIDTGFGNTAVVKVFWEKPIQPYIKGYVIYREKSGQGFVPIDTVSNTLFSSYIDSSASPESTVERYKIATLDSCNSISDISNATIHQTILLQGALDATNTYIGWEWQPYEGINYPNRYYRVMRDLNGTGVWDSVKATPWAVTNWNDTAINYPNARYAVEMVWQDNCNPSLRTMSGFNSTRSNIKNRTAIMVGIKSDKSFNGIHLYPNPAQRFVDLEFETKSLKATVTISDLLGRTVLEKQIDELKGKTKIQLNLEKLSPGIYLIKVQTENNKSLVRLVVE